jgi:hypothetical protein
MNWYTFFFLSYYDALINRDHRELSQPLEATFFYFFILFILIITIIL